MYLYGGVLHLATGLASLLTKTLIVIPVNDFSQHNNRKMFTKFFRVTRDLLPFSCQFQPISHTNFYSLELHLKILQSIKYNGENEEVKISMCKQANNPSIINLKQKDKVY